MPKPFPLPASLEALAQVCAEERYDFAALDSFSNQLVRVTKGKHSFFAGIGRVATYPLNTAVSASIVKDKAFTYQVLEAAGMKVPPYGYFFLNPVQKGLRGEGRERADAFDYAKKIGYPVFVKPIDGSRGALADMAFDARDLGFLLDRIAHAHHAALIQPVLTGEDRRLFLIDGHVEFSYRRAHATLRGDGRSTLGTLLDQYNSAAAAAGISSIPPQSPYLREALRKRDLALDSVLPRGAGLAFSARANISAGGSILDYAEDAPTEWEDWARRIMNVLGLRVCAIDFFAEPGTKRESGLSLIEVNSNPNLGGLIAAGKIERVHTIWRHVAHLYFSDREALDTCATNS